MNHFEFQDHLPLIEGVIGELCKGFPLLVDAYRGVITFDSLKNSLLLGLQDPRDNGML
ncbi:hypothetical protein HanIR_Chr03g0127661 [Helianthus annuus]|nr:hypothetical protein HanIR_Chr03g0127661 [Helianthus annuus]